MLNMYTNQEVCVLWNGNYSQNFSVVNGVKQGAIISPILFCVYLDNLLIELREAGVGCFIGSWFVGALAYADDLVLLAPTASAMRRMLLLCDKFSAKYNVSFNVNKSKCLTFRPFRYVSGNQSQLPSFFIDGKLIENVSQWPHLGHVFTTQRTDCSDIIARKNSLIGQVNNLLCHFTQLDSNVKYKLFNSFCTSFYGSELWNLDTVEFQSLCVAWRKGLRRVWNLPPESASDLTCLVADCIPLHDEISRRFMNFLRSCLNCGCKFVSFIVRHGIFFSKMKSPIGRNAISSSLRYDIPLDRLVDVRLKYEFFSKRFRSLLSSDVLNRANLVVELLLIRDGLLHLPTLFFDHNDIQTIINSLAITDNT
jgi:hypothetical protein